MTRRKGMMVGSGKRGYQNIIPTDRPVHQMSAKGIKQPQFKNLSFPQLKKKGVFLKYWGDADKDGVPNIKDCKPLNPNRHKDMPVTEINDMTDAEYDQWHKEQGFTEVAEGVYAKKPDKAKFTEIKASKDKKPSAFWSAVGKAEALALKGAKSGIRKGKEYLAEQKKKRESERIEELKEIDHPLEKDYENAKERVLGLERQIELNEDPTREDKLFGELDVAKSELLTAQDKLRDIDLKSLSDAQLKTLAIRHSSEDNFFSLDSKNKYEREILRRIRARKQLDADIEEEQKKPLKESGSASNPTRDKSNRRSSWDAFLNPKEDEKIFGTKK